MFLVLNRFLQVALLSGFLYELEQGHFWQSRNVSLTPEFRLIFVGVVVLKLRIWLLIRQGEPYKALIQLKLYRALTHSVHLKSLATDFQLQI